VELLKIGTVVKPSVGALRNKRDAIGQAGTYAKKNLCQKWYDDEKAKRGKITNVAKKEYGSHYVIEWDSGSISYTATYLVVDANQKEYGDTE
jgi:hypothetical protein